jgi:hypothetical protein
MSSNKWSCGVCTFENHKSVGQCRVCQTGERPVAYDLAMAAAQQASTSPTENQPTTDAAAANADAAAVVPSASLPATAPIAPPPTSVSSTVSTASTASVTSVAVAPPKRKRRRAARKALDSIIRGNEHALRNGPAPSAAHYVGYVEEGETVDMIMRKFAELEDVKREKQQQALAQAQQQRQDGGDNGDNGDGSEGVGAAPMDTELNEEDYEEIFNRTSNFTLNQAKKTVEAEQREMLARQHARGRGGGGGDDDDSGMLWQNAAFTICTHKEDVKNNDQYWDGSIDEEEFWDEIYTGSHKRRRKKHKMDKRPKGERRTSNQSGNINIAFVSDANGKYVTALRRVHDRKKKVIEYVRVPSLKVEDRRWGASDPKTPFSWAKQIVDYVDPNAVPVSSYVSSHGNVLQAMTTPAVINPLVGIANSSSGKAMVNQTHSYLAVMMTPPWKASEHKRSIFASPKKKNEEQEQEDTNRVVPSDLMKLPFNNSEWASIVFAFIWVRKDLISQVVDAMAALSFYYVENLCWVKQEVNNTFSRQPSPYIRTTHETLLIFRRGTPATGLVASRNGIVTWKPGKSPWLLLLLLLLFCCCFVVL